jgi:UDP-N-acetylglucosamine 1-carboxyvinyltransferase
MEPEHLEALLAKLEEAGARLSIEGNRVRTLSQGKLSAVSLKTLPYPGFPTDLQPQIMAALCLARGTSVIQERVFESRFLHVSELKRMGCQIELQGDTAIITGVEHLTGAEVRATDLRAGAALVLAGLAAHGYTSVYQMGHILRGYENMVEKLRSLGGEVEIVPCDENEGPKF